MSIREHVVCQATCDNCGDDGPQANSRGAAIIAAIKVGWRETTPTGGPSLHVCPTCLPAIHPTLTRSTP